MDSHAFGDLTALEERLRQCRLNSRKAIKIPDFLKGVELPSITRNMRPVKYDFADDEWADREGILLERVGDDQVVTLGRAVIPMLASGFTRQGAAAMFLLAYHLRTPSRAYDEYMFPDPPIFCNTSDLKYVEWPAEMILACGRQEIITGLSHQAKEAAVYAYIAATTLRLFTKSSANYVKAWNHITDGFRKFHGESIQLNLPTPSEQAVSNLARFYALDRRAKVALYRILYMSNEQQVHVGYKRFLYDIHLSHTGMHIVGIFDSLVKLLNCTPELLLTAINSNRTGNQVTCLVKLFKLQQLSGTGHEKKMWRYGRIFDETFMADLQTRTCPELVYTLAEALRSEAPQTHKDILSIAQLKDMSEDSKIRSNAAARKLIISLKTPNIDVTPFDRDLSHEKGHDQIPTTSSHDDVRWG